MIRRPPRSTRKESSAASDVYKRQGLHALVNELGDIDARALSSFPLGDLDSGITVRVGKFGTYVEDRDEKRANVPDDLPPDELTVGQARELLSKPIGEERELGTDPDTHRQIVARNGRFGPYVTEVLEEDAPKSAKARTGSLFKSMELETVNLEQALRLLSLPRVVGESDGEQITAQNGRYGPYLKRGSDSRSLTSEEQIFEITLAQAEEIYSQPKQRGRAAAAPLKELGSDPATSKPVVVKDGRFGPYVTDGEVNATLRKDDSVEEINLERAADLLAEKRAKGTTPKRTRKTPVRKAPAKRASSSKTTKSTPTTGKAAAQKPTSTAGASKN